MENKKYVVTLGRKYGAGGSELAKRLSEALHIPYYDKEILQMVSNESGIKESYFHLADEKAGDKILYKIMKSMAPKLETPSVGSDLLSDDNLFLFQSQVIKRLAEEESCIILGRCADYVLRDKENVVNIFVTADLPKRVTRMSERLQMNSLKDVEKLVKKTDKQRAEYYNYYTGKQWASLDSYELIMDSGILGIEGCVALIETYLKLRGLIG